MTEIRRVDNPDPEKIRKMFESNKLSFGKFYVILGGPGPEGRTETFTVTNDGELLIDSGSHAPTPSSSSFMRVSKDKIEWQEGRGGGTLTKSQDPKGYAKRISAEIAYLKKDVQQPASNQGQGKNLQEVIAYLEGLIKE